MSGYFLGVGVGVAVNRDMRNQDMEKPDGLRDTEHSSRHYFGPRRVAVQREQNKTAKSEAGPLSARAKQC